MFSTVYVSTLADPLGEAELASLLEVSRHNNARLGITGMLLHRDGNVMQLLEGDEATVRELYGTISADPRHHSVANVWATTSDQRRFPDWTMGFDDLAAGAGPGFIVSGADESVGTAGADRQRDDQAGDTKAGPVAAVEQRAAVLRRALVSGDRLVTALAIMLHGHGLQTVLHSDGRRRLRCSECRIFDSPSLDTYPCSTANNAIWALDAVLR